MTSLVNFSELCDYEEFRISYKEHISLMLSEVKRQASPVYLYFSAEHPVRTHIVDLNTESGSVILAYTPELSNIHRIIASGVFVVVDHMHSQIQFHIDGIAQLTGGEGSDYLLWQPDLIYLIQRRDSLRHTIPADDSVCCVLASDAIGRQEFPVLDLSDDGLAIMDKDCLLSTSKGARITEVDITLPVGTLRCELEVLNRFNIYLASEHKQVCRLGCRIRGLTKQARRLLDEYIQGLGS